MLSFCEFTDLLAIAQKHSRFETFQLAAAKHIDYDTRTGERTAQLVIQEVPVVTRVEVDELAETDRGTGGFGSSGAA